MLSKKIKIKDIEKFLSENPSFFIEHPQILQSLKFPSLKKNKQAVDIIHTHVDNTKKNFLKPPVSEIAPIIGEIMATNTPVTAIPKLHKPIPFISSEEQITSAK